MLFPKSSYLSWLLLYSKLYSGSRVVSLSPNFGNIFTYTPFSGKGGRLKLLTGKYYGFALLPGQCLLNA